MLHDMGTLGGCRQQIRGAGGGGLGDNRVVETWKLQRGRKHVGSG